MELERQIWLIRKLEKLEESEKASSNPDRKQYIIELKRKYRAELKNHLEKIENPGTVTFWDEDGESRHDWYLVTLPNYIDKNNRQEIEEYLWESHSTRIYSDYDCTGRWFTAYFHWAFEPERWGGDGNTIRVRETLGLDI